MNFDQLPLTSNPPPLVKDSSEVTLFDLDNGNFTLSANLDPTCQVSDVIRKIRSIDRFWREWGVQLPLLEKNPSQLDVQTDIRILPKPRVAQEFAPTILVDPCVCRYVEYPYTDSNHLRSYLPWLSLCRPMPNSCSGHNDRPIKQQPLLELGPALARLFRNRLIFPFDVLPQPIPIKYW